MYYKDNYIEFRIGIGIKNIISLTDTVYSLALMREVEVGNYTFVSNSTTSLMFAAYPQDGNYRLQVTNENLSINYFIYFTVNDNYIKEFIKQVESIVCNCSCAEAETNCGENKKNTFCLKRQRLFNLSSILPYTIKPFTKGESAESNPYLFKFYQLYFNDIIANKRLELGEEYTNYFLYGTNSINTKLFNSLIINLYYGLYYYSKLLLTSNTDITIKPVYIDTTNTFFNYKVLSTCFNCQSIAKDIENIMISVIENPCFCVTNLEPEPPALIVAENVVFNVPRVISSPDAVFNYNLFLENLINLIIPINVSTKFIVITNIIDIDNSAKKGSNSIGNILQLIEALPNNSIPISIFKEVPQEEDYNDSIILTCYVVDNLGRNSNLFTVTLNLLHTAIPLVEDLLVTIDNFTEAASTVAYKNLISFYTIASIGAGTTLSSVVWSIISTEFVFDGGAAFNPAYSVDASVGGGSASYSNLTPGYRYIVQLYSTNDVAQDCTFLMALDVLG